MNSTFGINHNAKYEFNEHYNDSKKIKNKKHHLLKIGAIFTAVIIFMSSISLPVSATQDYTLLLTTAVGMTPNGIGVDSATGNVYVANYGDNTVSVIDGKTNYVTAMAVGINPISVASGNGNIYVANMGSGNISVISGTSVIATIPVGGTPSGITFDSTTGNVYVANYIGNSVSVISGTSVIATIPVGANPYGITSGNGNVYVANFASNNVSVISDKTNAVTNIIPVGTYPTSTTFDSTTGNVYVANFGNNSVSVISGTSVIATIPVGANPYGITSGNGNVYVANYASNNISVINDAANAVTNTIIGLTNPTWIAFNSVNNNVYVINSVLNSVSIITASDPITTTPPPTIDPTSTGGTATGDTIAPLFVTIPTDITVFPISTLGATVTYTAPIATDNAGTPTVACDHPSGSQFPIGTTPVTCIATDAAGNNAYTSFNVKVYTPFEASQKVIDQLNGLGVLKSGTITSLTSKLPYSITMIPGNNYGAKNALNNFINEINSKCCSSVLNLLSSKPFTQDQATMFTNEAKDIVAATP